MKNITVMVEIPQDWFIKTSLAAHKMDVSLNHFINRAIRNLSEDASETGSSMAPSPKYVIGDVIRHRDAHERNVGSIIRSLAPAWDDLGRPNHQYFVEALDNKASSTLREVDAVLVKAAAENTLIQINTAKN